MTATAAPTFLLEPNAMELPAAWPPSDPLALTPSYELDPFQKHAVIGIHNGHHVFVTAKTGSGKTFVGEYLIARALAAGKRVFYTTPIKSLSNQKYYDLKRQFPSASVGILTGDIKMCPDAQIVVMTAEILRNLFYKRGTATEGIGLSAAVSLEDVYGVVMDEVHYIQDPDRGHVWEESLILCPRDLQLVLLSATMPSAAALAGWLANLHGRHTVLLSTTYRIVPLVHGVLTSIAGPTSAYRVEPLLNEGGQWIPDTYTKWLQARRAREEAAEAHKRAVRQSGGAAASGASGSGKLWTRAEHDAAREATAESLRASKVKLESPVARLRRIIGWLQASSQLPALFFVFSRRECERLAGQVEGSLLDSSDAATATHIIDFHLSRYRSVLETSPQYHQVRDLLMRGIAFHHSGLQPLLKEIVEVLFTRGYVKVLFATETFSVGLNMPTKTVVFLELRKWSDSGAKRLLRPDEYIQMAGRAGRRGIDTQGLVLYEPLHGDPVPVYDMKGLLTGALPPLMSRMRFSYEFVLRRLLNAANPPPIAEQSYWAVQQRQARIALAAELAEAVRQLDAARAALTPAQEALLATKAELDSAVASSTNAKRKKAQQALAKWELENADEMPKGAWASMCAKWDALSRRRSEHEHATAALATYDAAPLVDTRAQESCLATWEFITSDGGGLTKMGEAATEINEAHPILMSMLAFSNQLEGADLTVIATTLAAFQTEGGADEDPSCRRTLTELLGATGTWLCDQAAACARDELSEGFQSPPEFWRLNTVWPAIVERWMEGASLPELAGEFGMFEGNIQRGLLKVSNMLEEWGAVATLRSDLRTLETLSAGSFLRGALIVDSLYLRL
jgi:superfamily II RNA helicase